MMKTATGPFQRPHSRGWEEQSEDHLPCLLQIFTHLAVSKLKTRCFINRDRKGGEDLTVKGSFWKDFFFITIIIFNLKKTAWENNQERHRRGHCVCGIYYCVMFRESPWRKSSSSEPLPLLPVLTTRPLSPTGNGCGSVWMQLVKVEN